MRWVFTCPIVWLLAASIGGCALPRPDGTIPLGQWTGEGWFVAEKWATPGTVPATTEPAEPQSGHARYCTTLSISPIRLEGHDLVELKIQSEHADDPIWKDDQAVRLTVLLEEGKRVSESIVLYRLVDWRYNPKADQRPMLYTSRRPGYAASCFSEGGETVLVLNYESEFVDTIRFRGSQVEKTGSYHVKNDQKGTLIHWMEQLHRR